MIYLYAICDQDAVGSLEEPLRAVAADGLAAIVSDWHGEAVTLTEEAAWRHEHVVEQLMADGPALPARFGTLLHGEEEIVGVLQERRGELIEQLGRVRGAVELSVRGVRRGDGVTASSGRGYMTALVDRQLDLDRVHRPLEALARASHIRRSTAAPGFAAAYLVDEDAVEGFCAHVEELARESSDLELVLTGPWPPYSFASSEAA